MAYAPRVQYSKPPPRENPLDRIGLGLGQFAEAYQAEQDRNERRAQLVKENQRSDAYLKLQQDQTANAQEEERAKLLNNPEFQALMRKNPGLAMEIGRRRGIPIGRADFEAPGPSAPQVPQGGSPMPDAMEFGGGNQGADVGRFGSPEPQDDRNAQLRSVAQEAGTFDLPGMQRFGQRVAGMVGPDAPAPPQDLNAQRAQAVRSGGRRGYRLFVQGEGGQPGATLFDSEEDRQRGEAEAAARTEAFRTALGEDEKWGQMAAALARVPGLSEETIAKSVIDARNREAEAAGKIAEKEGDRAFTLKRDRIQNAAAMERARVSASATHPEGERAVTTLAGDPIGDAPRAAEATDLRAKRAATVPLISKLEEMKKQVLKLGPLERAPGIGQYTAAQQRISGDLDTMVAPLTQALGAGTPQEAEAKRKLAALTASLTQSPQTAAENIASLQAFLADNYDQKAASLVPTYRPGATSPAPAQAPAKNQNAERAKKVKAMTSPEDRAAINWAKKNPRDPRAAEILKANGM